MRGGLSLGLAFSSCEVLHVNLQRVASRCIAKNQLAGKLNLFLRDLVQRVDFRVIHDGHV